MATQTTYVLIDDITGDELDGGETINFSLDGIAYEIDLSDQNAEALRAAVSPFAQAGRRVGAARPAGRPRPAGSGDTATIRAWAIANGYAVADRGRIQADIVGAWKNSR